MPHVHVLQGLPDPFPRVEVRGLGRERLQVHRPGCPFGHNRAHVPLVHGRAVPDHQPFLRYRRPSGLEEDHALQAVQCGITPQGIESAVHRDATHDRPMIASVHRAQARGRSAGRIGTDQPRQEINARRVYKDTGAPFEARLVLRSGHTGTRHGWMIASSRGAARSIGRWGVPCRAFKSRETWAW
jgi:hypothetical protein